MKLLLTGREGRTGEYWPKVVAVQTNRSDVCAKTTEGQNTPAWLEQVRLVSSLLYGTRTKPIYFEFSSFHHQIYAAFDHFFEKGPYGKTCTK